MFNNQLDRFKDAQYNNEAFRNYGLTSQEIENKLRGVDRQERFFDLVALEIGYVKAKALIERAKG
jgi:hypothetical protein